MTGWLPKEILDHLEHAGYVAVPKERIECFSVRETVSDIEMMGAMSLRDQFRSDFQKAQRNRMAMQLGQRLFAQGFIDVQVFEPGDDGSTVHQATLYVIKPRTITKEPT